MKKHLINRKTWPRGFQKLWIKNGKIGLYFNDMSRNIISALSSRTKGSLTAFFLIVPIIVLVLYLYYHASNSQFDANAKKIIFALGHTRTYVAHVETEAVFEDRTLYIDGIYHIDEPHQKYMTVSTTTIVIPELKNQSHSFTLQNISIGDDVYSKITTSSSLFKKTIPVSPNWRHFKENAIPAKLADIAVAGPILDNSLLFSQSGKYISFVGKKRINLKGRPVDVYDFTLSGAEKNVPLALDSLMKRIGAEGRITIFIDFETKSALYFTLGNSSYHSTTTLISLDTPLSITPPILN